MKVFIVSQEWGADNGTFGQSVEVFKTEKRAREYMKQLIKDTEDEAYDMRDEDKNSFSAWQDGDYTYNHTEIVLEEKEVKE